MKKIISSILTSDYIYNGEHEKYRNDKDVVSISISKIRLSNIKFALNEIKNDRYFFLLEIA